MPDFQYTAREMSGQQVTGVLTASSRKDALSALAGRNLFPLQMEVTAETTRDRKRIGQRVPARHLAVFYNQLSDLLRSGVPLLRSLDLLEKQTVHHTLQLIIQDVREQVAEGTRLAEAMRRHPRVFGELAVSMIRAGEEGSFLEDVLRRIAKFTEHQQELKNRVVGAMVYPAFLLVAMTAVVIAMLAWFVPRFEPIFQRMSEQHTLPWATTALMSVSHVVQENWALGAVIVLGLGYGVFAWFKTERGRLRFDRLRLSDVRLPSFRRSQGLVLLPVGSIMRSLAIARFCRILGTLLRNGVPILPSLRIAKDATGNVVLSEAIGAAAEYISEGKSLANPLSTSGEFPEEIVEMIAVGEEANNLEQVLIEIADSLERRTNRLLDMLVRMLEPLLLTVMAGVVLFVVVALLLPILQSSTIL